MNPTEFACRSDEATKLGIEFLTPNERDRWRKSHEQWFTHIQELGRRLYDSFVESIPRDTSTKPWRKELPKRAERLSSLADRCYREDSGNEFGWRFKVENEIMYRFTVEVACPQCRNRIWESEIPAAVTGSNEDVEMLEYRRKIRTPCRCPKDWGDNFGSGINVLFSDRAEARIKHDPPLRISLQPLKVKKSEIVDRIYGLRETENFRLILDSTDRRYVGTRNTSLRESINFSPFSSRGHEPLLFPFLIMEAKSSKGRSRAETHMQSAFCIRHLLKIQQDLVTAMGDELQYKKYKTDPLVWYIATRGEQWDLYAGFVELGQDISRYVVVELWSGNIRHRDGALQLLLIVDYIFDWARDSYRKAILGQLSCLSIGKFGHSDPDVFSNISRRMSDISSQTGFSSHATEYPQTSFMTEKFDEELSFLNITLPEGVIRDAAIIESRYILIRVTEDNINDFLSIFQSEHDAQSWVSAALECLEGSWKVSSETLLSIESTWTGIHRQEHEDSQYQQTFYLSISLLIFMTDHWEPVRQLACLAVSEGALEILSTKSECKTTFAYDANPTVEKSSIESVLERTLNQSIMDNLTAAVSMLSLTSFFYKKSHRIDNHLRVNQSNGMATGFRVDRCPRVAQLVHYVYSNHGFGQENISLTCLNFSRVQIRNKVQYRGITIEMWPQLPRLVLESGQQGVLVDGASRDTDLPSCGLFVFSEFLDYQSLSRLVDRLSQEGIYFKTLQLGENFLSSDDFRYLNQPLKFKRDWKDEVGPEFSTRWRQKLENMMANQGYPKGAAFSCPIILSSDDETETEE
ncbi:hypothetical protein F1880_001925 [Penicillium rolfsii]|nr:hypothetical protein F1880_001925 [Penicillium rolfsii]